MHHVAVLGAGRIGRMVTQLLADSGDYLVRLGDKRERAVREISGALDAVRGQTVDFAEPASLAPLLDGAEAVVSCCPYECNGLIARQAVERGIHYLDLTEDVEVARAVLELADGSRGALIPQCGLAPGFITIVAMHLLEGMDEVQSLKLRVGALPRYPSNMLKYNLTWSTNGLVNEYSNPCEVLRDGALAWVEPLDGREELVVDGVSYEAFYTSGGVGSLCHSLQGRVSQLSYKSIRYPGHCDYMRLIMRELRLGEHPRQLEQILERALPMTDADQVVIHISAVGEQAGRLVERSYARTILHQEIDAKSWGAIQITTAAGVCGVLDLLLEGKLPQSGFVRQEQVPYRDFVSNRFGRHYA